MMGDDVPHLLPNLRAMCPGAMIGARVKPERT
jgi:hypothetical protein